MKVAQDHVFFVVFLGDGDDERVILITVIVVDIEFCGEDLVLFCKWMWMCGSFMSFIRNKMKIRLWEFDADQIKE